MSATEPITFVFEGPHTLRCEGAGGLSFYLPLQPVCGVPTASLPKPA